VPDFSSFGPYLREGDNSDEVKAKQDKQCVKANIKQTR
jgi:hypothetical protein